LDANTAERIAELEDAVDDLKRLGEGFQAKYLQTKAQLEATLTKLALTENELANTQQACDDLIRRCDEISTKAANDIAELQSVSRQQVADLEAKHADEMSRYRSEMEKSLDEKDSLIAVNGEKVRVASDCTRNRQPVMRT
jgi:ABC-type transporter Mla subunit MlaD